MHCLLSHTCVCVVAGFAQTFAVAVLLFECAVRTPPWPDYPNDCRGADGIVRYDTDSLPVLPAEYPQGV